MKAMHVYSQRGVGLVQVMVGIALSLVVTLAIYQIFAGFDRQRRTTVGAASAQQAGALGLFLIGRELRMAGWGIAVPEGLSCSNVFTYQLAPNGTQGPMADVLPMPVTITEGGAGQSDRITISGGNSERGSAPVELQNQMLDALSDLAVVTTMGFNQGDFVWLAESDRCTLMEITGVDAIAQRIAHAPSTFNPPASYASAAQWPGYSQAARIFNMGRMERHTYEIIDSDLHITRSAGGAAPVSEIAVNDVVDLQAQYGLSVTRAAQDITAWLDGSAVSGRDADRIKAIRVALVTRSNQIEKPDAVTGTCRTTTAAPTTWPGGPVVDLSADALWTCYRYRVYQTIIPLTNVLWATS